MNVAATAEKRLTAAEAEALWRAWTENGDAGSRDHLILSYAPMVRYLATRKARSTRRCDDPCPRAAMSAI